MATTPPVDSCSLVDVARDEPEEERRRVRPDVVARVVADLLEADEGERAPVAVAQPQAVAHLDVSVAAAHEEVEVAALDRQLAAELLGTHHAVHRHGRRRILDEAVDIVDGDRQLELQLAAVALPSSSACV